MEHLLKSHRECRRAHHLPGGSVTVHRFSSLNGRLYGRKYQDQMDHETAVRIDAAARYYLRELAETELEAFEDHVAECSACIEDLRCLTIFAANTKAIVREENAAQGAVPRAVERRQRWLD